MDMILHFLPIPINSEHRPLWCCCHNLSTTGMKRGFTERKMNTSTQASFTTCSSTVRVFSVEDHRALN